MRNKKIIVLFSILGTFFAYAMFNSREVGLCNIYCGQAIGKYQDILLIFPIILFFSLATYFAKDSVFKTWWKFARIAVPIVLLITFIISLELHHSPGGWFNTDNEVDIFYTLIAYFLFCLGSVIAIVRGYRRGSSLN